MAEWNTLTLFIDESGTFENEGEPWIVGGVLFAEEPEAADAIVQRRLRERWPVPVAAPDELHMNDLARKMGSEEAAAFAADLLSAPEILALVAVSNRRKRQAKSRESNYRQMLSDLIALTSNVLDDANSYDLLHIVVATRTIDHQRQSFYEDIHRAINAQEELFARALVSRGLFDRFDSNSVKLHQETAAKSWGLGAADVLCNTAWVTERDPRNPRAQVLRDSRLRSKTVISTAFAKPRQRRAENFRIEGQWGASLAAWLMSEKSDERSRELRSVALGAFDSDATSRGPLAVEGALEVLHRSPSLGPDARSAHALELADALKEARRAALSRLRCNLFALLHANHAGDDLLATRAAAGAHAELQQSEMPPEHWQLAATLALLESEAALNALDLPSAWEHVVRHERMIQAFGAAWELVQETGPSSFALSDLATRATMAKTRVGLWARTLTGQEARDRLSALTRVEGAVASRVRCLLASAEEAMGADAANPDRLLPFAADDAWSAYWALRLHASIGTCPTDELLAVAEHHAENGASLPYLRAALSREAALATLPIDASRALRHAERSVELANQAGEGSDVLHLLLATCVATEAAVNRRPWRAIKMSPRLHALATAAGLEVGRPVSAQSALEFRFGSIR